MRTGRVFLAGAVALGFCFALAGRANAQFPILPPPPDFVLSGLSETFTLDSIGAAPISCLASPTAVVSDFYSAKVKMSGIRGDFVSDLTNNTMFIGFVPSCSGVADNAFVVPPGALHMVKGKGSFFGSVPDTIVALTSGQDDVFGLVDVAVSITGKTGTLTINGNADLCEVITESALNQVPVCLFVDLASGFGEGSDEGGGIPEEDDIGCTCATPTINFLDYTSTGL